MKCFFCVKDEKSEGGKKNYERLLETVRFDPVKMVLGVDGGAKADLFQQAPRRPNAGNFVIGGC